MCKHCVIIFEALSHLLFISLVTLLYLFYWATFGIHTCFYSSRHGLFIGINSCYIVTSHHILTHWLWMLSKLGTLRSQIRIFLSCIIFDILTSFDSHASCHSHLQLFLFLAHAHCISFIAAWHWLRLNRLYIRLLLSAAATEHCINSTHHGTPHLTKCISNSIVNSSINLLLLHLLLSPMVLH